MTSEQTTAMWAIENFTHGSRWRWFGSDGQEVIVVAHGLHLPNFQPDIEYSLEVSCFYVVVNGQEVETWPHGNITLLPAWVLEIVEFPAIPNHIPARYFKLLVDLGYIKPG